MKKTYKKINLKKNYSKFRVMWFETQLQTSFRFHLNI